MCCCWLRRVCLCGRCLTHPLCCAPVAVRMEFNTRRHNVHYFWVCCVCLCARRVFYGSARRTHRVVCCHLLSRLWSVLPQHGQWTQISGNAEVAGARVCCTAPAALWCTQCESWAGGVVASAASVRVMPAPADTARCRGNSVRCHQ